MESDVGILQIGDRAPDFQARSTSGDISFYDWLGDGWAVMLSYRETMMADCVEEFRAIETLQADFAAIGCKTIGCIVEDAGDFDTWSGRLQKSMGRLPQFPVVHLADRDGFALHASGGCSRDASRKLVVIGPDKRIKLVVAYSLVTASMFGEIVRLIESLQYAGERRRSKPESDRDNLIVLPAASGKDKAGRGGIPECGPVNGRRKDAQQRNHC